MKIIYLFILVFLIIQPVIADVYIQPMYTPNPSLFAVTYNSSITSFSTNSSDFSHMGYGQSGVVWKDFINVYKVDIFVIVVILFVGYVLWHRFNKNH